VLLFFSERRRTAGKSAVYFFSASKEEENPQVHTSSLTISHKSITKKEQLFPENVSS
jgi:hypothetical protein